MVDTTSGETAIEPISDRLVVSAGCGQITIQWKIVGFQIQVSSMFFSLGETYCDGEVHSLNFDQTQSKIEVSSIGLASKEIDLREKSSVHSSRGRCEARIRAIGRPERIVQTAIYESANFRKRKSAAILYLHGGPYQRFGNEYNPLFVELIAKDLSIWVPQYFGDPAVDNTTTHCDPMAEAQVEALLDILQAMKKEFDKVLILGHSFGAYLGLQLSEHCEVDLLLTANGVFDHRSLLNLAPKTFSRSRYWQSLLRVTSSFWIHLHSEDDKIVPTTALMESLSNIASVPHRLEIVPSMEHELLGREHIRRILDCVDEVLALSRKDRAAYGRTATVLDQDPG